MMSGKGLLMLVRHQKADRGRPALEFAVREQPLNSRFPDASKRFSHGFCRCKYVVAGKSRQARATPIA